MSIADGGRWSGAVRSLAALLVTVALLAAITAGASLLRPEADRAAGDDRVVATLAAGGRAYSDDLRAAIRALRARPGDLAAAQKAARLFIAEGRDAGDSRLVGAALGALRPWLGEDADAETLLLAATARQYQHDFTGALALLDRAIEVAPDEAGALLMRATIRTVRGEFDQAEHDCQRLRGAGRVDLAFLCQAAALTLTDHAPAIYERLEQIVADPRVLDPGLRGYALGLLGEIAMLQGWNDRAREHLAAVLDADPGELRTRMLLADLVLAEGDPQATLATLEGAPDVDGVLLRRAIAADRIGADDIADPAKAELARRFARNLDLGLTAHAREEARYFLELDVSPAEALSRARVNWSLQHEFEDAQLLLDAAALAGEPAAALPVLEWIETQGVSAPALRIPPSVAEAAR